MNKTEFMSNVAAASGLNLREASLSVNAALHVIMTTMQQGGTISLPGFGTFTVKERPERMGRNPRTGAAVKIAAKRVVKFHPGTGLKIRENNNKE